MFQSRASLAIAILLSYVLLVACQISPPFVSNPLPYLVSNNPAEYKLSEIGADDIICSDGLKAKVTTGKTLMFESPTVKADEPNYIKEVKNPQGFRKGSPMTIEAWCYDRNGEEEGYFRYENTVTGGRYGGGTAVQGYDVGGCLEPTSSSGKVPCVTTTLFDFAPE